MWWMIFPALLILFLAVIIVRAAAFKSKAQNRAEAKEVELDAQKAINDLQQMIRCKTVSSYDESLVDFSQFERFQKLLEELFPNVRKTCTFEKVGKTGLLYRWKGTGNGNPTVLMAHYDVVPVNEDGWEMDAFAGEIIDGVLWGRGTLDTKNTLNGVMQSVENLIGRGFIPQNDIYLAFAGDEEIAGTAAPMIVEEFAKRGITPGLVVDEGGAVVEKMFPGVTIPCALVGTGEKGMMNLEFKLKSAGGHASAPPPHTVVGKLAKAVVDIENHPFPGRLTPPAAEMFDTLGRHSSFTYKLIFANLWCFKGVLDKMCKKSGGELNALMRTTVAFTQMYGSKAANVLAPEAEVIANLRLMGGDTVESAREYLRKIVKDNDIELNVLLGMNPSPYSSTTDESWAKVKSAIEQTWTDALVSPYLMVACSDSRHYSKISKNVYKFSAMALSKEERAMIHGNNERIPVNKIVQAVKFYIRLIQQC